MPVSLRLLAKFRNSVPTTTRYAFVAAVLCLIRLYAQLLALIKDELAKALAERDRVEQQSKQQLESLQVQLANAHSSITRLSASLGSSAAAALVGDDGAPPMLSTQAGVLQTVRLWCSILFNSLSLQKGKRSALVRQNDPLRFFDRRYLCAVEKELLDTREELDDLKTAIDETEATINNLKAKFPHLEPTDDDANDSADDDDGDGEGDGTASERHNGTGIASVDFLIFSCASGKR